MIACANRVFLVMIFSLACVPFSVAEAQKLSSEAQATMNDKLQQSSSDELLVFNRNGAVEATFDLDLNKSKSYKSLSDLLISKDSPISTCKKPTPTPPPGCVICEDGHPICTKAIKGSRKSLAPTSSLPNTSSEPR